MPTFEMVGRLIEHKTSGYKTRIAELEAALQATGHRPYRKNTTHWHEPNESGYCPGCAALAQAET